jgi:hypothetical protein
VVTTPVTALAYEVKNGLRDDPSGPVSTLHGAVVTHPVGSPTQVSVPGRADQVTGI